MIHDRGIALTGIIFQATETLRMCFPRGPAKSDSCRCSARRIVEPAHQALAPDGA